MPYKLGQVRVIGRSNIMGRIHNLSHRFVNDQGDNTCRTYSLIGFERAWYPGSQDFASADLYQPHAFT